MIGQLGNYCNGLGGKCGHSSSKEDRCLIDGRRTTGRPCPADKFDIQVWTDQGWRPFRGYYPGTCKEKEIN